MEIWKFGKKGKNGKKTFTFFHLSIFPLFPNFHGNLEILYIIGPYTNIDTVPQNNIALLVGLNQKNKIESLELYHVWNKNLIENLLRLEI